MLCFIPRCNLLGEFGIRRIDPLGGGNSWHRALIQQFGGCTSDQLDHGRSVRWARGGRNYRLCLLQQDQDQTPDLLLVSTCSLRLQHWPRASSVLLSRVRLSLSTLYFSGVVAVAEGRTSADKPLPDCCFALVCLDVHTTSPGLLSALYRARSPPQVLSRCIRPTMDPLTLH